jgi:hypothetical protein
MEFTVIAIFFNICRWMPLKFFFNTIRDYYDCENFITKLLSATTKHCRRSNKEDFFRAALSKILCTFSVVFRCSAC